MVRPNGIEGAEGTRAWYRGLAAAHRSRCGEYSRRSALPLRARAGETMDATAEAAGRRLKSRLGACGHEARLRGLDLHASAADLAGRRRLYQHGILGGATLAVTTGTVRS